MTRTDRTAPALFDLAVLAQLPGQMTVDEALGELTGAPLEVALDEQGREDTPRNRLRTAVASALGMDVTKPIPTDDQLAVDVSAQLYDLDALLVDVDGERVVARDLVEAHAEVGRLREELQRVYGWLRERPFEPVARGRFHAEQAERACPVWVVVDDYGMGAVAAGPFDTAAEAGAYDPTDDRFEVRVMTTGQYRDGARPWQQAPAEPRRLTAEAALDLAVVRVGPEHRTGQRAVELPPTRTRPTYRLLGYLTVAGELLTAHHDSSLAVAVPACDVAAYVAQIAAREQGVDPLYRHDVAARIAAARLAHFTASEVDR